ncbi:hypothetical protein QUF80_04510 [Desulfococcaceae bacterium HSG8]|nr:hypothetical protein [Desulfococcaceae bacterium HSG8]
MGMRHDSELWRRREDISNQIERWVSENTERPVAEEMAEVLAEAKEALAVCDADSVLLLKIKAVLTRYERVKTKGFSKK